MSGRTDAIFLRHILDASLKVASYIGAMTEADFVRETMTHDAVMRQLEIIGEATKNLSAEFRGAHPTVPWKDIAGMRDRLIHGYMAVDLAAVWDTATKDVPELRDYLQCIVGASPGSNGS
jgi:uncharacterized protein with HEPN domain